MTRAQSKINPDKKYKVRISVEIVQLCWPVGALYRFQEHVAYTIMIWGKN